MQADIVVRPSSQDRPNARMGGTEKNIPLLYLDNHYGDVRMQFRADESEVVVAYLDRLIQAATDLRQATVAAMPAVPK